MKQAIVTGAGGGLGFSICKSLSENNFSVAAVDLNLTDSEKTSDKLNNTKPYAADVRDEESINSLYEKIDNTPDLIVNNAGIARFGKLFDHFAPKIKSYGMMLRSQHTSPQMAEELVQDVMLKVWLKAHCFDVNKASASTWIFTIARNCRTDFIRKANRTDTELSADDLWPMAEEEGPYTSLHQRRIEKNIHSAVAQLPPEQADVLKRIYIEGKSHSEVSAATGLPLGTVKSRVRLAVGKLRTLL